MKINKQEKSGNKVTIEVESEYSELTPHIDQAYKQAAKEIKIPGFRHGKVPSNILKTYLTEESVVDKAIQGLVADIYPKVIEGSKIEPVDYPDIEIIKLEKEKPFTFKIKVDVYPLVKIGNYKTIKITKPSTNVSDKEVENMVESIRNNLATAIKISDRGLQEHDVAAINIQTKCEGKTVPQLTRKGVGIDLGKAQISVEFDKAILGMKTGESKRFTLSMPDEFYVPDLRGKNVDFNVDIKDISEKSLPPLDDTFAKTVSKSTTVAAMRDELRSYIVEDKKKNSEQTVRDLALDRSAELVDADIPPGMIDREIDLVIDDFEGKLRRNGSNVDIYLKSVNKTMDGLRSELRDSSIKRVKAKLLIRKIVEDEKIEALPAELEKELEEMSKVSEKTVEEFKDQIGENGIEAVKDFILRKKAVDHLVSRIKIEEERG